MLLSPRLHTSKNRISGWCCGCPDREDQQHSNWINTWINTTTIGSIPGSTRRRIVLAPPIRHASPILQLSITHALESLHHYQAEWLQDWNLFLGKCVQSTHQRGSCLVLSFPFESYLKWVMTCLPRFHAMLMCEYVCVFMCIHLTSCFVFDSWSPFVCVTCRHFEYTQARHLVRWPICWWQARADAHKVEYFLVGMLQVCLGSTLQLSLLQS